MSDAGTSDLGLALSPYFLATREAPAMTALLLGSRVVTLLPTPAAGDSRASVRRAADHAPRFLRLLDAWSWSGPLWRNGMVAGGLPGNRCGDELSKVYHRIDADPRFEPLRRVTRHATQALRTGERIAESGPEQSERHTDERAEHAYLDLLCADLLKGGADPGVSVPVVAAIDRFSAAHDLISVRGDADSLTQRIESKLARRAFSFGMPVLLRASGTVIARQRREMSAELDRLRAAILSAFSGDPDGEETLRAAAATYAAAFDRWSATVVGRDDELDERIVPGFVSIAGVFLPVEAAIRSGQAAVSSAPAAMAASRARAAAGAARVHQGVGPGRTDLPTGVGAPEPEPLFVRALVVRESRARPSPSAGQGTQR